MTTLALSTSGSICSLAAIRDGVVLANHEFPHEMHLLERLMPMIAATLADLQLPTDALDLYAVDVGPGSFTGVRIGVMTVKALAWAVRRPVAGISSLEALAAGAARMGSERLVALVRGRPGFAYWQPFSSSDGILRSGRDPELAPHHDLAQTLIGMQWPKCLIAACDLRPAELSALKTELVQAGVEAQVVDDARVRAITVAARAELATAAQASTGPLELAPLYVAAPVIGPPATRG